MAKTWWVAAFFLLIGQTAAGAEDTHTPRFLIVDYKGDLELRFAVPAAARIGEIRAPALILVGESDIADVHAYAGAIELGVWGAKREVVRDAGHLLQLEQAALVATKITRFIEDHPLAEVSEPQRQRLAGSYAPLLFGRPGDLGVMDGRLVLHIATERDLPLFASNDSTFYALVWGGMRFAFISDA